MQKIKVLHVSSIDRTILFFRINLLNKLKEMGYETYVLSVETFSWVGQEITSQGHIFKSLPIKKSANPINLIKNNNRRVSPKIKSDWNKIIKDLDKKAIDFPKFE